MYYRRPKQSETNHSERIKIFLIASGFITFIIIGKLFQLQVLAHDYYQGIATSKQYGYAELPAQRGEIIIKDHHSQEEFLLATNTTFNLLFAAFNCDLDVPSEIPSCSAISLCE